MEKREGMKAKREQKMISWVVSLSCVKRDAFKN